MNFLAVPLKSTYEVDLVKPLHAYVDSILQVNSELKTEIKEGILELNKFRNRACLQPLDNHQISLDLLMRYFDQLTVIENKLPITVTQNPIAFKWKDAFCKGALFFSRASFTCSDSSFERAAVLFNIGALMSAIASSQHTRNDEELKVMTKLFQQAAGVFIKLKESTLDLIQQEPTPDLMPEMLTALSALMLAQAQEAIYIKAIKDRMKPAALVKILSQCAEFYQEVQKLLTRNGIRGIWDKEWPNTVNCKAFAFAALAQYHASQVSAEAKEVGEQISRLSEAKKLLEQANNYISPTFAIEYDAIKSALTQANKDNNLIYHEKVPEFRSLPPLPKAVLVKALPLTHPLSPGFHDIFESLVPVSVQNALFTFESMKADLINTKTLGMRECTLLMNGILTSLNLPAALDDVINYARCPKSIRQKSAQIRAFGGVRSIQLKLAEIQTFFQRNNETLNTITCLIDQEQSTDSHLRSKYGAKWTRISSDRITGPLYQEIAKNRELLRSASKSDSIIMSKFEHARKWIEILSKPEDELESFIPNLGGPTGSLWNSETVKKLHALMKKVDAIKSEREQLGESLKEVRFNMRDEFLRSMTSNAVLNEEKLSNEKINELYGPLQRRISDNIKEQESILAEVHIWNTKFCKEKGGDCIERENILKELAKAYDIFFELEENLKEGIKFYNDLTQRLTRLHQKISDFCFARETEKEDMLLQFQRTSVYSSQAQSQQRQHPIYPQSKNRFP